MPRILETQKSAALLAGGVCYVLALLTVVLLPDWLTDQSGRDVVGVDGVTRQTQPYTAVEQAGRDVYGRQICWHCHSQFVRPVNDEDKRWGPVSQTGEYAYDVPHFFGTRRVGPDLFREGGLRVDDWHYAHLYNPRYTVPMSVMPGFTWLFTEDERAAAVREALALLDTNGDGVVSTKVGDDGGDPPAALAEAVRHARMVVSSQDPATKLDRRGVRGPGAARDSLWWNEAHETGDGLVSDYDAGPRPTADAEATVAYLQRLGTNIGRWRRPLYAPTPNRVSPFDEADPRPRRTSEMRVHGFLAADPKKAKAAEEGRAAWARDAAAWDAAHPLLAQRLSKGRDLYERHCAGCHGVEGRGNGPAAAFLLTRPRDFTVGKFKFRSTPVGSLPTDADLYRALFRGLPGSSMPSWRELADEQLWLLVDYVKQFYEGEKSFNDRASVVPVSPPQRFDPHPEKERARGRAVYMALQCYNCHGKEGRADGPGWSDTTTDWGGAIRPRDLRPRIGPADSKDLYDLMGRELARWFGPAWEGLSATPAWKDMAPTDDAKAKAFASFLLGEGPRVLSVFGEEAVKKALGARYDRAFEMGDDPLEDLRMAVATEKDQPALRFRGGAYAEDLYRTILTGLDGTGMKATFDAFWKKDRATLEGRDEINKDRRASRFVWTTVVGDEKKLSIVTGEAALKAVGVYEKKDGDTVEEFIKMQPGDDWALVRYVQWLMCVPRAREGR